VSYGEPNADDTFARLLTFAPAARWLPQSAGLHAGYRGAAAMSDTPLFFMVDGDAWIRDGFVFSVPDGAPADIYFWRAMNPVNGLVGFMGGLKLLRRRAVRTMPENAVDPLLSMQGARRMIQTAASETRFNASPFLAWKAAFRECAKLTAGIVNPPRRRERLEIWQTVGADTLNGDWCMLGARMGAAFGARHRGAPALGRLTDNVQLKCDFDAVAASDAASLLNDVAVTV
jgi:hypothetical protein